MAINSLSSMSEFVGSTSVSVRFLGSTGLPLADLCNLDITGPIWE
jgi:hypothetical protein